MGTHVKVDNKVIERDQNRYRKVYRHIRKKPFPLVCDDGTQISDFVWGAYFVEFKHEHEVVHHFPCCYDLPPAVIATTVGKTNPTPSGTAKISYLTFGEDVTADGYDASSTSVGSINAAKRAEIESEWIDLKNVDDSIYRVKFTDGVSPDNSSHSNFPGYAPTHTTTVNISDVDHYGTGTTTSYSGGTAAAVTFEFKHAPGPTFIDSSKNLTYSVGSNNLSVYLQNLWWDFKNKDGSVWRIKITGGGNYPEDHAARTNPSERPAISRSVSKLFDISPTGSTLGAWITSFKSLLGSTDVGGSKFTDKWEITSSNGTSGSVGAKIIFTAKTGNKGALAALTNPIPSSPSWYDSYNKGKDDTNDIDVIAHQVAATNPSDSETESVTKGLLTKIIDTINNDATFSSKWTASVSSNSVERVSGSNHYESFILTFTASASNNIGIISNIVDTGAGSNPGTFHYNYGSYGSTNSVSLNPAAQFFVLTQTAQYRNEKYPDNNQNPPNPVPVLTTNGSVSGTALISNPNFNVFVTDRTASQCTFRTSGYYTGYVHYQAIKDGVYTMPDIGRTMEIKTLAFTKTNTQTYSFTVNNNSGFTCLPIVTATADHDVNVFITEITKTTVTVQVSQANYTGNVFIQAIEKGC